jgi:phosphohistidine phosphatase
VEKPFQKGGLEVAVYLMQHGIPVSKTDDPERPLSAQGIKDVENLAEFLQKRGITVKDIYHSGKRRARETAEIMGFRFAPGSEPKERRGLSPLDDVGDIADQINKGNEDLLIAGHLPHLEKLTSLLVIGNESVPVVSFRQGGLVCLEQHEDKGWTVAWMLVPEIIG